MIDPVIAQRIGSALAFTASRYFGAVREMPPDLIGYACFVVVIAFIWMAFRGVGLGPIWRLLGRLPTKVFIIASVFAVAIAIAFAPSGEVIIAELFGAVLFYFLIWFCAVNGRAEAERREAERIEAEREAAARVHAADEAWSRAERARRFGQADDLDEDEGRADASEAAAEAAWREAEARANKATQARDRAEAARDLAQCNLEDAAAEWDAALHAAAWARHDLDQARVAREAARRAPRDEAAIERAVSKIRALRQWTTTSGRSEAEASSAACKVAQLCRDLLGLGLSPEEINRRCS